MVLGRLRGATSEQLGEAAHQLGVRLQRHQAALAASLTAAIERGGACLPRPRIAATSGPPSSTGPANCSGALWRGSNLPPAAAAKQPAG